MCCVLHFSRAGHGHSESDGVLVYLIGCRRGGGGELEAES